MLVKTIREVALPMVSAVPTGLQVVSVSTNMHAPNVQAEEGEAVTAILRVFVALTLQRMGAVPMNILVQLAPDSGKRQR